MSQENVEIVRALAEGFQLRQHEQAFEFCDPDIKWDSSQNPGANPDYAGITATRASGLTGGAGSRHGATFIRDPGRGGPGDEVVLLVRNQRQWGRRSGIVTELPPHGMVFTIRGGKVVRWVLCPDQESALEAAGVQ